jgi:two-component sensor histidine kinase
MRHRLRNAYAIASAIVMQSARGDPNRLGFAELVCARLADVALSQTQLLDAANKTWALSDLVRTLIAAHGEGRRKSGTLGMPRRRWTDTPRWSLRW